MGKCCYCGSPATGKEFAIHRDGFDQGPEVPLCVACGEDDDLTCEAIWQHIADLRAGDTKGSAR